MEDSLYYPSLSLAVTNHLLFMKLYFFTFYVSPPLAYYKAPLLRCLEEASGFVLPSSCRVSVCGILLFARSIRTQVGQQNGYSNWNLFITDTALLKSKQYLADKREGNNNEDYPSQCVKVDVAGIHILDNPLARLFDRRGVRMFLKDLLYSGGNTGNVRRIRD